MKNLLLIAPLVLGACAAPGNIPLDADGPVARTIERVLQRTEAYMVMENPPVPILPQTPGQVAAAAEVARAMLLLPEASGTMLLITMAPLMDFHDMLVSMDPALDALERAIYLESTARLRSLFNSVNIHEPEPAPEPAPAQ